MLFFLFNGKSGEGYIKKVELIFMYVFLLINFYFIVLSLRYFKFFNIFYLNNNVSIYWGLFLVIWFMWFRGILGFWGLGEGEFIFRVDRGVIYYEVMFRVDFFGFVVLI